MLADIGYAAASTSSASVTVSANAASFELVFTAFYYTPPGSPANLAPLAPSALPSPHPTLRVGPLLGGQTVYFNYTVEDIGTLPTVVGIVTEKVVETSTNCDGALSLGTVGLGPTTLSPLVPQSGTNSISDGAGSGQAPPGCTYPLTSGWTFYVNGTAT